MKKLALSLTLVLGCYAASAQGLIRFANDSKHLVYYSTDATQLLAGDTAGSAILSSGLTAAGDALSVTLMAGTSPSSLLSAGTTTVAGNTGTPGTWAAATISGFTASTTMSFQVLVYDSTKATSYADAITKGVYYGSSPVFTAVTSSSVSPNSIVSSTSPAFSTWAAGTQSVTGSVGGGLGAIALQANVPEPTSLALLGLGAAGMMIFRRRK